MRKLFLLILFCFSVAGAIHAQSGVTGPLTWEIIDGVIFIRGNGAMPNYSYVASAYNVPWEGYKNIITGVDIGAGVTSIGDHAFLQTPGITSLSIPGTVKKIGQNAFHTCSGLKNLEIGEGVTDMGSNTFCQCISLTSVSIPGTIKKISNFAFAYCYKLSTVVIGEGVTEIGNSAFFYSGVKSIIIPQTVSSIGTGVFDYNSGLLEIVNYRNVPQIITADVFRTAIFNTCLLRVPDVSAYKKAEVWKEFNNIVPIESATPGGTAGPLTWKISDGVLTISGDGSMPDYNNSSERPPWYEYRSLILSVNIEEGVTKIGLYAFSDAVNLKSVSVPASVRAINYYSFLKCSSLTTILVDTDNLIFFSYDGVLFTKNHLDLFEYPPGKQGNYSVPDFVKIISNNAFYYHPGLDSIVIPSSVETIGAYAFRGSSVQSVTIAGNTLNTISAGAFSICANLTTFTIPASVTSIGGLAFSDCQNMSEIVNLSLTPQIIDNSVFSKIDLNSCILRVPAASIDAYKDAAVWGEFPNIVALETDATEITLDREVYLLPGATATITATVNGAGIVTWKSSDETVATVNNKGSVTAINAGIAAITATIGSIEAVCSVTVIGFGRSTIEGVINNPGSGNIRVNLYISSTVSGQTKRGILGGYVLLATTIPNCNGEYSFENLPEGSYKVEVEMDDYEPGVTNELPLSDKETISDVNFTVDDELRIIIVDEEIVPSVTTGILETGRAPSVKIYPNPFTDVVRITGTDMTMGHAPLLLVFNTAGAIVHTQTITSPEETIHLGHLPAGLYIIRLENGNSLQTFKVIKIQ